MRRSLSFRRVFLGVAVLWFAWCISWPFYALQQDKQQAIAEASETEKVCLQQPHLTRDDCVRDEELYRDRMLAEFAPKGKNAFQIFAGDQWLVSMTLLIVLPLLVFYGGTRLTAVLLRALLSPRFVSHQYRP